MVPQFFCRAAQVVSEQPQTFGVPPPPQTLFPVQKPQSSMPPQPSEIVPHVFPSQVTGTQPQTLLEPQVCGEAHAPHTVVREPPHKSKATTVPQFLPNRAQSASSDS